MNASWTRDLVIEINPTRLTREQFVAKYLPQYVREYSPPTGLRLNARGRVMMSSRGSVRAQVTKREHRIDEAYNDYLKMFEACTSITP